MNILSFDIEEWYIAQSRGFGSSELYRKYDRFLKEILDKLEERSIKATFFCLGMMAEDFPEVVKTISGRGHEVGCHSHKHLWANKMTESEFREDTRLAVTALEQCIGEKIQSYRAPAFSIGESNLWAFDVLAENGITRDASVFPAPRDFGGFPSFGYDGPVILERNGWRMAEFPVSMAKAFGRRFAYSGGGYFRLMPDAFIRHELRNTGYVMSYFHLNDILPGPRGVMSPSSYEKAYGESGNWMKRAVRSFKNQVGREGALAKMFALIDRVDFSSLDSVPIGSIQEVKSLKD